MAMPYVYEMGSEVQSDSGTLSVPWGTHAADFVGLIIAASDAEITLDTAQGFQVLIPS